MNRETLVTEAGLQKLQEELDELTTTRREQVAERIKQARDFGDISENAEYDDAKNEQARLEARILQLEERIRTARVVSEVDTAVVGVGTKVNVIDQDSKEKAVYVVVGSTEADPLEGRVSNESPVGKALMGRKKGEIVEVAIPSGKLKLKITQITAA